MRMLPLLLWAALAVTCVTQTSTARSLVEPLGPPQSLAAPGNILPAFVSPGTLGAFLTAVREATFITSESRTAAEALSARFFDDAQVRHDGSESPERASQEPASPESARPEPANPEPAATVANSDVHLPYIFKAALSEPSLVKPEGTSLKHTKKQQRLARRTQAQRPRAWSFESATRPVRHRAPRDYGQLSKSDIRWLNG